MNLRQVLQAVTGLRSSIADLDREIAQKREQIAELERAPAHIDDVLAWARRGLQTASDLFKVKVFEWYWTEANYERASADYFYQDPGPQLLALHHARPSSPTVSPSSSVGYDQASLDLVAVTHFLRPLIEKELEKLVREAFPDAERGMRHAERMKLLNQERAALQALEAQREEIVRELRQSAEIASG